MKIWALLAVLLVLHFKTAGADFLKQVATIPLPDVTGRFDHFAIDPQGHRLFVAALGNNSVEILDVATRKRITSLRGLSKPTGIAFLAAAKQIGAAAGGEGVFKIFGGEDYKLITTITALDDADNVRLDTTAERIYVGYGDGALAIIDAKTLKKIGDIELGSHPESFQLEQTGHRIFVNLPGTKEVAIVDREKSSVVGNLPLTNYRGNFPMALDEANHRLFVGCRQPPRLLVFDTETKKQIADAEISSDTDDLFYDAKRKRIYISCGEGFINVLNAQGLNPIQKIPTRSGARTSFFSPALDQFYLAAPNRGGDPAEIRIFQPVD
jgi:YVTN family beta-propeller protein